MEEIEPGFHILNLKVNPKTNKQHLKYKKSIHNYMRLLQTGAHRSVMLNLKGVFEYQDGAIEKSVKTFEEVLDIDAENLNALANLGFIFSEVLFSSEAGKYAKRLEECKPKVTSRARCLFEQGYMLAYDVFVEARQDVSGQANIRAQKFYMTALKIVDDNFEAFEYSEVLEWCKDIACNLGHISRHPIARSQLGIDYEIAFSLIVKFFFAVTCIADTNYQAQAWMQLGKVLGGKYFALLKGRKNKYRYDIKPSQRSHDAGQSQQSQRHSDNETEQNHFVDFLESFWERRLSENVLKDLKEEASPMGEPSSSDHSSLPIKVPAVVKELHIHGVHKENFASPEECLAHAEKCYRLANELTPNRTDILNRYAYFLWRKGDEKSREKAEQLHKKSIELDSSESNWYAFKSMGDNLRLLYKNQWYQAEKSNEGRRGEVLNWALAQKAKKKIKMAVCLNPTPTDFANLAEMYHFLGIDINRRVVNEKMMRKSLFQFKYAVEHMEGEKCPDIHQRRGKCLQDLGQDRSAIESFKNAVYTQQANSTFLFSFVQLVNLLMDKYEACVQERDGKKGKKYLGELKYCFITAYSKFKLTNLQKEVTLLWDPFSGNPTSPTVLKSLVGELMKSERGMERNAAIFLTEVLKTFLADVTAQEELSDVEKLENLKDFLDLTKNSLSEKSEKGAAKPTEEQKPSSLGTSNPIKPRESGDDDRDLVDETKRAYKMQTLQSVAMEAKITPSQYIGVNQETERAVTRRNDPQQSTALLTNELSVCDSITVPAEISYSIPDQPAQARNAELENDFYVVYADGDRDWVCYHLLTTLEVSLKFRGCLRDRDFLPGSKVLENITAGMANSMKTIVVISHEAVGDSNWQYELHQAVYEGLTRKASYVIPIVRETKGQGEPSIPKELQVYVPSRRPTKDHDWHKIECSLLE
ncbi:uncharacterized protein LOC106153060 [Lingula anatina]|uniref:Uncharacterized protein LOC106153060 n=1 Tax=Lingula anatina TaxID=7574 RepID=A0A1S3H8F5_LINAN|nr:uncharacterized protein LOC106153060 [Lingula anatina]XP_013382284.1 uncharacterized protein LOC106153060 [Lingula anatina]|eukprot:XP_013382283.1 uncharacterized protein LOC106153060 [Lingula anatina]